MPYARTLTALSAALAVASLTSACGARATGAFRAADGTCQVHQTAMPGTAYTAGGQADTESIMVMMGSYTAHGRQPYCDGHPATSVDRSWRHLYVRLGGMPVNVAQGAPTAS